MNNFDSIIARFDLVLQKFNKINYARLQPPLNDEQLQTFSPKKILDDRNVTSLYRWKNGVAYDDTSTEVFDFQCSQLSIQEVLAYKNNFPFNLDEHFWPLFAHGNDEVFLFNSKNGADYGKVHLFSVSLLSIENPYSFYDSLESMFLTTIKLYEEKGLVYNEKMNYLECNIDICSNITKEMNPNSSFYTNKYP